MEENKNLPIHAMSFDTDTIQVKSGIFGGISKYEVLNGTVVVPTVSILDEE